MRATQMTLQKDSKRHATWLNEMKEQMKHRISENLAFFKASAGINDQQFF